ncbi:DUF402 domain-containing protein [Nocardioides taihuensis]|uniref:DUF402 domain-containing protein n=1 Tax=Nocardioides taihuensis TaxID=1835606 RepID=A0ABW0BGV4_9ACTN
MTARRPSGTPPYWEAGTIVTLRWGDPLGPHWAEPVRVVRDDAAGLVTWLAEGTPVLRRARADGLPFRGDPATMFTAPTVQARATWTDTHVLRVSPTGRSWSVMHFFDGTSGEFLGWYGNIEDPHQRDHDTVYSADRVLDVWVEPDRTVARKDEDELALAVEQGRYTEAEAERLTAVAAEIEAVVAAWGPPFCDGWDRFEPDPSWEVPGPPDPLSR